MTSVQAVADLARRQEGCVARWQLILAGWSTGRCDHALAGLRRVHDGVYVSGYAPLTTVQRWWAATLTAPRTVLSHGSAACCWGLRKHDLAPITVTRPGRTGPQRFDGCLVRYSATLRDDVSRRHGFWITTPERTVIDTWPQLRGRARERLLRDAVRLGLTTTAALAVVLARHGGRRGTASLRTTCAIYERLPLHRCRSDAEVEGLVVLDAFRVTPPQVNERRAGEEADFSWEDRRLIVEIDGPRFHQDKLEDARKTRAWIRAGYTVRRIPSDDVYATPERLIALVRMPTGTGAGV